MMQLDRLKGRQTVKKNTICELHRRIYDILVTKLIETRPDVLEEVIPLLEEAFTLGIKVTDKLIQYKLEPQQAHITEVKNPEEVKRLRKLRIELVELLKNETGNRLRSD